MEFWWCRNMDRIRQSALPGDMICLHVNQWSSGAVTWTGYHIRKDLEDFKIIVTVDG
jgi:hypothetical protein